MKGGDEKVRTSPRVAKLLPKLLRDASNEIVCRHGHSNAIRFEKRRPGGTPCRQDPRAAERCDRLAMTGFSEIESVIVRDPGDLDSHGRELAQDTRGVREEDLARRGDCLSKVTRKNRTLEIHDSQGTAHEGGDLRKRSRLAAPEVHIAPDPEPEPVARRLPGHPPDDEGFAEPNQERARKKPCVHVLPAQNVALFGARGKGMTSRMLPMPVTNCTKRSVARQVLRILAPHHVSR